VHLTDGKGDQMAEAKKATHDSLNAGFTTLVPQGSHGGATQTSICRSRSTAARWSARV
jgi:hypothetical protein